MWQNLDVESTPAYPFIPKSTALMRVGQFWSIPLAERHFASGRVLQFRDVNGKRDSRIFVAGLLNWIGDAPPSSNAISGAGMLAHGAVHIRTISSNSGQILGCRDLDLDRIELPLTLSERNGPLLMRGFQVVGNATPEQRQTLPVFST
jgi:hypothetical protein